jgi:hypothetical protein
MLLHMIIQCNTGGPAVVVTGGAIGYIIGHVPEQV